MQDVKSNRKHEFQRDYFLLFVHQINSTLSTFFIYKMTTEKKSYEQETKSNQQQAENYKVELCNLGSKTILKVSLKLQQRRVYLKL